MKGSITTMLNIRKTLIPCAWMFGVVHFQDIHNHPIEHLCLSISLRVEGSQFFQLSVHHKLQVGPKSNREPIVSI